MYVLTRKKVNKGLFGISVSTFFKSEIEIWIWFFWIKEKCIFFFHLQIRKCVYSIFRRRESYFWSTGWKHLCYNSQKAGIVTRRRFQSVDSVHGLWHFISRFVLFFFNNFFYIVYFFKNIDYVKRITSSVIKQTKVIFPWKKLNAFISAKYIFQNLQLV